MKAVRVVLLLLCIAVVVVRTSIASTNAPPPLQIVTCREEVDLGAFIAEFKLSPRFIYEAINGFAAPMSDVTIQKLKTDERVLSVHADWLVSLLDQTNSTGLVRMGIDQFPVASINGIPEPLDVAVAVLDTGIDQNHPDLNLYTNYTVSEFGVDDVLGHGTTVAGVIGAIDNGFGVVGVSPGIRLWNVKLTDAISIPGSVILGSMNYVWQHADQVSVANMSFATTGGINNVGSSRLMVRRLVSAGVVVVAGAGNLSTDLAGADGVYAESGFGDDITPASLREAMAVSAMDPSTDSLWPASNFSLVPRSNNFVHSPGGTIDVAAPGVNILTTSTNGGYAIRSGTSLAAPHVAGLVALYIATHGRAYNEADVYRIRQAIVDTGLAQSHWNTNNPHDPDQNPEPLALPSMSWSLPMISTQPKGLCLAPGDQALLIAETTGMRPLTYQWLRDGTNLSAGGHISGVTSNVLSFSTTALSDAGAYQIIVTNAYGMVTSAVATLSFNSCNLPAVAGAVSHWQFNSDTRDSVGTNDGASLKGVVFGPAVAGNGLLLDARSGPIQVQNNASLNPQDQLTLEAWFKTGEFTTAATGSPLLRKASPGHEQYSLLVNSSTSTRSSEPPYGFTFTVNRSSSSETDSGRVFTPPNLWSPGSWYHVVGTYDGTAMKIYLNGTLVGSRNQTGPISEVGNPLWIGGEGLFSTTNTTPGRIDEVLVYNRALTGEEIAMRYAALSAQAMLAPTFVRQPQSLTVPIGGNANFSVFATGAQPLFYQWLFNGTPISGETNTSLDLTEITTNQAGDYSVLVTNAAGSFTSREASLRVGRLLVEPGDVLAIDSSSGEFIRYRPTTHTFSVITNVGGLHNAIALGDGPFAGTAWLANSSLGRIAKLNLVDGSHTQFASGIPSCFGLAYREGRIYATSINTPTVYVFDAASGNLLHQWTSALATGYSGITWDPANDRLILISLHNGRMDALSTNGIFTEIMTGIGGGYHVTYEAPDRFLVGYDSPAGAVRRIILGDSPIMTNVISGIQPPLVAAGDGSGKIYLGNFGGNGQLRRMNADGTEVEELGDPGDASGTFYHLMLVASHHVPTTLMPPVITSIVHSNSFLTLTWSAVPGQKYQVQSAPWVNGTSWTNLGGTVTATVPILTFSDTLSTSLGKFFRIQLIP